MRSFALALVLLATPLPGRAQSAPRSLAVDLGFSSDSAAALGSRSPLSLVATWWLAGGVDATARATWAFAARSQVRAADQVFEAGGGLRWNVSRWGSLRPQLLCELAFVQVFPTDLFTAASGVRVGAAAALEAFLGRDASLTLSLGGSELLLADAGGPGVTANLRAAFYF